MQEKRYIYAYKRGEYVITGYVYAENEKSAKEKAAKLMKTTVGNKNLAVMEH